MKNRKSVVHKEGEGDKRRGCASRAAIRSSIQEDHPDVVHVAHLTVPSVMLSLLDTNQASVDQSHYVDAVPLAVDGHSRRLPPELLPSTTSTVDVTRCIAQCRGADGTVTW